MANTDDLKGNVTLSVRRRPVGRPRSRISKLEVIQTRIPEPMYRYCKTIQSLKYKSLTVMFDDMIKRFLEETPWNYGLQWRQPKSPHTFHAEDIGMTGWKQVNISIEKERKDEIIATCKTLDISMSKFTYTALYWWIQFVYPHRPK